VTTRAHNIIASFEALEPVEKQQVAAEILRRSAGVDELTGETFDELAAELFQSYDDEEAARAND